MPPRITIFGDELEGGAPRERVDLAGGQLQRRGGGIEPRLAVEQLGLAVATLHMIEQRQVVDATERVAMLDAKHEGYSAGDVLELKPKRPTAHFTRLLFYVERTPARIVTSSGTSVGTMPLPPTRTASEVPLAPAGAGTALAPGSRWLKTTSAIRS